MAIVQTSDGDPDGQSIGQSATDKVGFHGAAPVARNAAIANATDAASVILRLNDLLAALRTKGLIAT